MNSVCRVVQQVPDDDQDGSSDGDDGLLLPATAGDPPVALTQEGVGSRRRDRGFAQDPGQVAVAVTGGAVAEAAAGGLLHAGAELRPGREMGRGREPGHVGADLGDDHAGRRPDRPRGSHPAGRPPSAKGAISVLDPVHRSRRCRRSIASTWASIRDSRNAWCSVNRPSNACRSSGIFFRIRGAGHRGQDDRVAFPSDQGRHHRPPRDARRCPRRPPTP